MFVELVIQLVRKRAARDRGHGKGQGQGAEACAKTTGQSEESRDH